MSLAVVNSWTAEFIDYGPLGGLQRHVSRELTPGNAIGKIYARYCSIVQSSGMGKSRLLDEFSRSLFLIPVNLRPANSDGFPPPDNQVRDFLLGSGEDENRADSAYSRMTHFLCALFTKVQETIGNLNGGYKAERIGRFRVFMSEGQSMRLAGGDRQTFYSEVVRRNPKSARDLINALSSLRDALNSGSGSTTCAIFAKDPSVFVDIFIAFDEAHSLTTPFTNEDLWTNFTELRRALRELREYPLWSFFLSTTGKITQFSQPRGLNTSSHINRGKLITPSPFIYLGLDQLMESRKVNMRNTLDDVISLDCVAHMGRPMWGTRYDHGNDEVRNGLVDFAIHKLLGTVEAGMPLSDAQMYAVLSQRLALDIDTPQYLLTSTNPFTLMETMHEQIANHMRVCLAVGSGIESLRGVASSEPILSEASSRIMSDKGINFNLPLALSKVLSGFCINQGACGELLVAAFFMWARDKVMYSERELRRPITTMLCRHFTVKELFDSLFLGPSLDTIQKSLPSLCHRDDSPLPFEDVFKEAHMHFNHFIKPYERKIVSHQYLVRFMARGAAALGANCQPGFDAVYPYLYKALNLDEEKLGFIIVQVKNDSSFNPSNINEVFRKMDPFECGLLDKSKMGLLTIPIIHILFLLSG
ncbi:hypothetical protein EDB84DRAFT_1277877 [Lactarius hengduanensis]|nr:hypothetical protein EDB84DRAFT_1277877 [Lactarius hengduanensis]